MKKPFRLNAYLAGVHSRRYRKLFHEENNFPLRVNWVEGAENSSLSHRLPYIVMRRYPDGISRSVFIFTKTYPQKVKTATGSILRWEDDGGLVIDASPRSNQRTYHQPDLFT